MAVGAWRGPGAALGRTSKHCSRRLHPPPRSPLPTAQPVVGALLPSPPAVVAAPGSHCQCTGDRPAWCGGGSESDCKQRSWCVWECGDGTGAPQPTPTITATSLTNGNLMVEVAPGTGLATYTRVFLPSTSHFTISPAFLSPVSDADRCQCQTPQK